MSAHDNKTPGSSRRRRIVIESSIDEEDSLLPEPESPVIVPAVRRVINDSIDNLLDSDDDSLEGLMQTLRVTDQETQAQQEGVEGLKYNAAESDSESLESGGEDKAKSQASVDSDVEDEETSAWAFDRTTQEYFLSQRRIPSVFWPSARLPASLYRKLYGFQKVGVQWMASLHENRIGGLLGDDMGMGKTYTALSYLGSLMRTGTIRSALVIAPLTVLRSWENEARKILTECVSGVAIQVVNSEMGGHQRRNLNRTAMESSRRPHLIITTYGLVQSSTQDFVCDNAHWDYVVLDEAHQIKNHTAKRSLACRSICHHRDTRRIMLTGTPILNDLKELWSLFDWVTSGKLLGPLPAFKKYFAKPIEAARDRNASEGQILHGMRVNEELQTLLKPYFLQRMKIDFLRDKLPEKTELVVWTHLSARQRAMYTRYVGDSLVKSIIAGDIKSPLEAVTWLKKLCGHPIIADATNGENLNNLDREALIRYSAKLGIVSDLVVDLRNQGHRTLIFSQSTKMLDIIEKVLRGDVVLARIDGTTREQDRQRLVDKFNSEDSAFEVMLLSTKATGIGLTLTGADRVIIYDPSWTFAEDAQAVDRTYRIGQQKCVVVYRLIAAGTVEEKTYEKQIHKDGLRRTVFGESTTVQRYFNRSELRALFTLAPSGVCDVMQKANSEMKHLGMNTDFSDQSFVLSRPGVVGLTRHDFFYYQQRGEGDVAARGSATPFGGKDIPKIVLGRSQRVLLNQTYEPIQLREAFESHHISSPDRGNGTLGRSQSARPNKPGEPATLDEVLEDVQSPMHPTRELVVIDDANQTEVSRAFDGELADSSFDDTNRRSTLGVHGTGNGGAEAQKENSVEPNFRTKLQSAAELSHGGKRRRSLSVLLDELESSYTTLDPDEKIELHKSIAHVAGCLGLLTSSNIRECA